MPLELFYSYAHEDEALRNQLNKHLSALEREGLIVGWHDRDISAGSEWRDQISAHLQSAHIILFLVSADFLASDYCYDVEVRVALERHARHEAVVIPIILRSVDWMATPFAKLQALPRDAKPVTSWTNQDEAFTDIARGIREIVQRYLPSSAPSAPSSTSKLTDRRVAQDRVLDAAIPSHIVKDLATELLVQIHLPESGGLKGILQADEDAEARPEDVRSKPFGVVFPLGPDGRPEPLKTNVKLTSPDFAPLEQTKTLFVPPDGDSEVAEFLLTPTRTGRLLVLVELQWEDALRGSRSLRTECIAEATGLPAQTEMNVVRIPLKAGAAPTPVVVTLPESQSASAAAGQGVEYSSDKAGSTSGILVGGRLGSVGPHGPGRGVPESPEPTAPEEPDDSTQSELVLPTLSHGDWQADGGRSGGGCGGYEEEETQTRWSPEIPRYEVPRYGTEGGDVVVARKGRAPGMSNLMRIALALIAIVPATLVGYWQFVYKPSHSGGGTVFESVVISGQVLSSQTLAFVPGARVTLDVDNITPPSERYTDSNGTFLFRLTKVKPGTQGRLYVRANGFEVLDKNFTITDSALHEELRLQRSPQVSPPQPTSTSLIAGRVVDGSTSAGLSHASISLAGRSESYLTDDNGNFRIRLGSPVPSEGVRLQIKKAGCDPRDQVVRPPVENLMLELSCKSALH